MSEVEKFPCFYTDDVDIIDHSSMYVCVVKDTPYSSTKIFRFDVKKCRNVKQVEKVKFLLFRNMPEIPPGITWNQFPNLKYIRFNNVKLERIHKDDFNGLQKKNLKGIAIIFSLLEYIPGDLFEGMDNLEDVDLADNKIKYIGPEIIPSLMKLKCIDLSKNINISMWYDKLEKEKCKVTLEDMKRVILEKCKVPAGYHEQYLVEKAVRDVIKFYCEKDQDCTSSNMSNILKDENSKDLTITVNAQEFKVHKFLLIARSPILAEMIQNNQGASNLKLENIHPSTFEHILDFLYNDTLPHNASLKDIYIAADRLKIEKLKNFAGTLWMDQMIAENPFEIITLAYKYGRKDLRLKAFEEVKRMFPEKEFKDGMGENDENLKKLFEFKRKQEQSVKKLKKAYENFSIKK